MSDLSNACTLCNTQINAQFVTGPRTTQTISGDVPVTGSCFVADEIIFNGSGKLIFSPNADRLHCVVVCRKLIVNGGNPPITLNPCNPGDPGTRYNNTNVITWAGRLTSAPVGAAIVPSSAADGATPGADGSPGAVGNTGGQGASPGRGQVGGTLTVIALEVDIALGGNLVIDWAGEDGGDGGTGQNGGGGAKGANGNNGKDASWPSSGCDTATGNGGDGGNGGPGGIGGTGGNGGNAGQIIVISTPQNLSGVFSSPTKVTFVTQSVGGNGGKGGHGGTAGAGGNPGKPTSSCGSATKGDQGNSLLLIDAATGGPGGSGSSLAPLLEPIDNSGTCSSVLPIPLQLPSTVPLQTFIRCFSGATNGSLSITGADLDQVASVSTSLAGVTATIKNSSTETQLDLGISIAANSASGACDLIFGYTFPPALTQTLAGAINVEICQAVSITPNSGAQGTTLNVVTIKGTGFDVSAANHNVTVSGLGVNVNNPAVVDDSTMTCQLEIDATAAKTARDVTVQAGLCQYTLSQSFTVT